VLEKPEPFIINLNEITPWKSFKSETMRLTDVITKEELVMFSDGVINRGRPVSRPEWTPKQKGFSDTKYRKWQGVMLTFELIEPDKAGFKLTEKGRKFFTYWATSPTHEVEDPEN